MELSEPIKAYPWVKLTYSDENDPFLKKGLIESLEFATGRKKIERIYNEVLQSSFPTRELWTLALKRLKINMEYDANQLAKAPKEGPLVLLANHPFGLIDGLMISHFAATIRERFFVIVNETLCKHDRIASYMLPIDFRETKEALRTNLETRKIAVERLKQGEALAIFPAGGVATARTPFGKAYDLKWKRFVAKLVQQSKATVVPIFFHGHNSRLFQIVSQISLPLRYGLFLHEARRKMGTTVQAAIGDPIVYERLPPIKNRQELLDHLQEVTFRLAPENSRLVSRDKTVWFDK